MSRYERIAMFICLLSFEQLELTPVAFDPRDGNCVYHLGMHTIFEFQLMVPDSHFITEYQISDKLREHSQDSESAPYLMNLAKYPPNPQCPKGMASVYVTIGLD